MVPGADRLQRHKPRLLGLLLVCMTAVAYWQVQYCDFLRYDDPYYVTGNATVSAGLTRDGFTWAFSSLHASNWHPATWLSHMLDCQVYGLNPIGHHFTSLLLHIANVLLLFLFLRESTGHVWRSFLVAGLFAVHPLHVESVVWIAERKDVLSVFLAMLTLVSYGRYTTTGKVALYLFSLFLYSLGLLAKPTLVVLPLILLLLDYWPFCRFHGDGGGSRHHPSREAILKRLLAEKAPFMVLAAGSSCITYIAQSQGGAVQTLTALPLQLRLLNGIVAYARYLYKTFVPDRLAVFYPHPGDTLGWLQGASALLLVCAVSGAAIHQMRRRPHVFVGWFWFAGSLVPVLGFVQVGLQALADRYTYLPHIGLFTALVWGLCDVLHQYRIDRRLLVTLISATMLALVAVTWRQVGYWQDTSTLFHHALKVTRGNYAAHFMLAREAGAQGDMALAFSHYDRAVDIHPAFVAMMHNRIGHHLYSQGDLRQAELQFTGALGIRSDYSNAHNNLGVVLAHQERYRDAIRHFLSALKLSPGDGRIKENLENAQQQLRTEEAK